MIQILSFNLISVLCTCACVWVCECACVWVCEYACVCMWMCVYKNM